MKSDYHPNESVVSWNFGEFGYQFYGTEGYHFKNYEDPALPGRYLTRGHIAYVTGKPKKGSPNELQLSAKPCISNLRVSNSEPPKWKFVINPDKALNDSDDKIYKTLPIYPFHQPDMQGFHQHYTDKSDQWVGSQWTQTHPLYGLGMKSGNLTQNFYTVDVGYDLPTTTFINGSKGRMHEIKTDNPWNRAAKLVVDDEQYGRRAFVIVSDTNSVFHASPVSASGELIDVISYPIYDYTAVYGYNVDPMFVRSVACPWPEWVKLAGFEMPFVKEPYKDNALLKLKPIWEFSPNGKYAACVIAHRDEYPFASPTIVAQTRDNEGLFQDYLYYDYPGMVEIEFVIELTGFELHEYIFKINLKQDFDSRETDLIPIAVGYAIRDMNPGAPDPCDVKAGEGMIRQGDLLMAVIEHTIDRSSIISKQKTVDPQSDWYQDSGLPGYYYNYYSDHYGSSFVTIRFYRESGWFDVKTFLVWGHWARKLEYERRLYGNLITTPGMVLNSDYTLLSDEHRFSTIGETYGINVGGSKEFIDGNFFTVIGHLVSLDLRSCSFTIGYSAFTYCIKRTTMSFVEGQALGVQAALVIPYVFGTKVGDDEYVGYTALAEELKTIHDNPDNYRCDLNLCTSTVLNVSYDFNGFTHPSLYPTYLDPMTDERRITHVRFQLVDNSGIVIDHYPTIIRQYEVYVDFESPEEQWPGYIASGYFPATGNYDINICFPQFYVDFSRFYHLVMPGMTYLMYGANYGGENYGYWHKKDDSINGFPCGAAYHIRIHNLVMSALSNRSMMTRAHPNGSYAYCIGPVAALPQVMNLGEDDPNTYEQMILDKIVLRTEYTDKERKGKTKARGESTHLAMLNEAFGLSMIEPYYYFPISKANGQFTFRLNITHAFPDQTAFAFVPSNTMSGAYHYDNWGTTVKHFLFPLAPGWASYFMWGEAVGFSSYTTESTFGVIYSQYKPVPVWPRDSAFSHPAMEGLFG
jgi:hypothetical protein